MAASDHVNGVQLRMFMHPHELADLPFADAPTADDYWKNELLDTKLKESHRNRGHGAKVGPSVQAEGVHVPVSVYHDVNGPFLSDGHHRLAAALFHRPDQLVPVQHQDEDNL